MLIQLASDLHLEHLQPIFPGERLIAPAREADLLVLAGDIANGTSAVQLFAKWPVPVVYVAGNHEFYDCSLDQTRLDLRHAAEGTAIRILDNESAEFGAVRFLGATLWTDYRCVPGLSRRQAMERAERSIQDHRAIQTQEGRFSAARALEEHRLSRHWLERQLATPYGGKTVVVTHHAPHPLSIHSRFAGNPVNASFVSDLSELLPRVDLWLHGHVHNSFDYRVGGCRVAANPRGYARNRNGAARVADLEFENPEFGPTCVIEV